jgi:hypothetical protein
LRGSGRPPAPPSPPPPLQRRRGPPQHCSRGGKSGLAGAIQRGPARGPRGLCRPPVAPPAAPPPSGFASWAGPPRQQRAHPPPSDPSGGASSVSQAQYSRRARGLRRARPRPLPSPCLPAARIPSGMGAYTGFAPDQAQLNTPLTIYVTRLALEAYTHSHTCTHTPRRATHHHKAPQKKPRKRGSGERYHYPFTQDQRDQYTHTSLLAMRGRCIATICLMTSSDVGSLCSILFPLPASQGRTHL